MTKRAVLAQRLGRVFAAPTTWYQLVRTRGWRRPRTRVHPEKPIHAVRATAPDELWHVDTTLIKLIDNTKVHLQAVIDNFSRKILAGRAADHFDVANTVAILREAAQSAVSAQAIPTFVSDAGVENINGGVDDLIEVELLSRVLALKDVTFSNSMIEAWRRRHRLGRLGWRQTGVCRVIIAGHLVRWSPSPCNRHGVGLTPAAMAGARPFAMVRSPKLGRADLRLETV